MGGLRTEAGREALALWLLLPGWLERLLLWRYFFPFSLLPPELILGTSLQQI